MYRCGSGLLLILAIAFVVALTGCLGKSSSNPSSQAVASVTLSPSATIAMDSGSSQVFSATARNATGNPILGLDIQFIVQSGSPNAPASLSILSNGNACAGAWNAGGSICSPGNSGIALVTAVTNGISSAVTTVYVHQHIDSIQVSRLDPQGPPQYECFSQGQNWTYEATAYSNNVDITNTVGPITWTFTNSGVVTVTPLVLGQFPNQQFNQAQVTAKTPGITQLLAIAGGVTSTPYPYTTCLVQAVYLQIGGQGQAGNSITVDNGGSISVTATVVDTLYNYTRVLLNGPPLTWSTTNPEVAAFSTLTNTTGSNTAAARANLGGATLTASCTPPTCNIGILPGVPVYATDGTLPNGTSGFGSISVDVTSTAITPTYTTWAATTGCQNASGCSSALFSVTPNVTGADPISAIVSLPRTPNSMMFNHVSAARVYLGSDQGLMYLDVGSANPSVGVVSTNSTPCNVAVCGKVLAISNDGKQVVVSDTVSVPSQVYIYNSAATGAAPIDLILSNAGETATVAAFSPDQSKVFILSNLGNMYVYSTVDALTSVSTFAPGTDVEFSADGSFAYVAGVPASAGGATNAVSSFPSCSPNAPIGTVTTSYTPSQIFPSPVLPPPFVGPPPLDNSFFWTTQNILALEQPPSANQGTMVEFLQAEFTQLPLPNMLPYPAPPQLTCNPPMFLPDGFTKGASFDLGQGNFAPVYAQVVADGTAMIIVANSIPGVQNIPAVLVFNVSNGTTTSIPLARAGFSNTYPLSAAASTDGSQVFVAACDQYSGTTCTAGSIHVVNTCGVLSCNIPPALGQGDFLQVPYVNPNDDNNTNMCNNAGPNAPVCFPNLIAIKPD